MKFKGNLTKDEYYNKSLKYKDINKEKYLFYLLQAKNLGHKEALPINYINIIKKINNENMYKIINSNIDKDINGTFYNYLGLLYKHGVYVEQNEKEILYHYEKAIEKGNSCAMLNLGCYYKEQKDYNNMKKYFLMVIEKGNSYALYNLGCYYQYITKDYENMIKYFLMAIEKGCVDSMNRLGCYYYNIKEYENMMKYYLMAIDKGNVVSMNLLGLFYYKIKDYGNMMKYYLMAIDKGYILSMNNLGKYYYNIKNYENMVKYYLMAIDKRHVKTMFNLGWYYHEIKDYENMEKYYLMAIKPQNNNPFIVFILNKLIKYYNESNNTVKLIKLYKLINNEEKLIPLLVSLLSEKNELTNDILDIILNLKSEKLPIGLKMLRNTIRHNINIIDLHFNYMPGSDGHNDALEDYKKYVKLYNLL
jgi:TPR repeat protein